jgi:glycine/D-amino acid oxidase-like deaminating enzyme
VSVDVAVIGGGLAGSLLALELAGRGRAVLLIDADHPGQRASALSYGAMAAWAAPRRTAAGRLQRQAPRHWRRLQRLHGDLGWRPCWFRPLGPGAPLGGRLPLPCSRVEATRFLAALPAALARAGVMRRRGLVQHLEPSGPAGRAWTLHLASTTDPVATDPVVAEQVVAEQVVLAAGAGCRALWPALPQSLRVSWAGVLLLQPQAGGWPWSGPLAMRLPARFSRLALEARAPDLTEEAWEVDPALLPWGERWLAGQISLVRPALEPGPPPDAALQEQRLRRGLAAHLPALASWPGQLLQVPVSFSSSGAPLVGPLEQAPGLWIFAGFGAAFSVVPALAAQLADRLARERAPVRRAGG